MTKLVAETSIAASGARIRPDCVRRAPWKPQVGEYFAFNWKHISTATTFKWNPPQLNDKNPSEWQLPMKAKRNKWKGKTSAARGGGGGGGVTRAVLGRWRQTHATLVCHFKTKDPPPWPTENSWNCPPTQKQMFLIFFLQRIHLNIPEFPQFWNNFFLRAPSHSKDDQHSLQILQVDDPVQSPQHET